MTHPLTPREKVEREVLDAVFSGFEHGQCEKEWEPEYGKEIASLATDAILTALASGSGDHAELALNAKAAQTWALGIYENREQAARRSTFIDSDLPATVLALLAEIAALRGEKGQNEDDWAENLAELRAESQSHMLRAAEAERKLAEAVGLLRTFVDTHDFRYGEGLIHEIPSSVRKAKGFLSKEAERGCS